MYIHFPVFLVAAGAPASVGFSTAFGAIVVLSWY